MTWHLKDRELEKKLEEFTGGNFVNSLNREIERENIDSEFFVRVGFGRKLLGDDDKDNCLLFRTDELEEVHEYNPKAWNDSRKVTPPQNTIFRAKVYLSGLGEETIVEYDCLIYQYCSWYRVRDCKPFGGRLNITKDDHVEFRPWDD